MDSTTRLLLQKPNPDPVTGDFVDISVLNANMDKIDSGIGATICTSATRPTTPWHGQLIRETDTRRMYVWNATQSAWDQIAVIGSVSLAQFEVERAAAGDHAFRSKLTGNANQRWIAQANGTLLWGDGTNPTDTNLYRAGTGLIKTDDSFQAVGALNSQLVAVKGANEIVNNSITLQDDDHLFISVEANATYLMDAFIIYNSPIATDLLAGWTVPGGGSGASFEWSSWAPSQAHSGTPAYEGILKFEDRNYSNSQSWGGTGAIICAMPRGCLKTVGTAGIFRFRWAQNTATVADTTVYANSWIRLHRVA